MHKAARGTDDRLIQFLLQRGANFNARNADDKTPLHLAAEANNANAVALLLRAGADSESQDARGNTALHCAAEEGDDSVITVLALRGANFAARNFHGDTVLHRAAAGGDIEAARMLVRGRGLPVESAGKRGAGIECALGVPPTPISSRHKYSRTPYMLSYVIKVGEKIGLQNRVDHPGLSDGFKSSMLTTSDCAKNLGMLVDAGLDPTAQDLGGKTLLHTAAEIGCREAVEALGSRYRGLLAVLNKDGETPLQSAIRCGFDSIIQTLENLGLETDESSDDERKEIAFDAGTAAPTIESERGDGIPERETELENQPGFACSTC